MMGAKWLYNPRLQCLYMYIEVKSTYPEGVQTHDSTDSSGTRGHLVAWSCQRDL